MGKFLAETLVSSPRWVATSFFRLELKQVVSRNEPFRIGFFIGFPAAIKLQTAPFGELVLILPSPETASDDNATSSPDLLAAREFRAL